MRLLQITGTLDPAYGGPPVVVEQITREFRRLGHCVDTITLDQPSAAWLATTAPGIYALPGFGKYRFSVSLLPWLRRNSANYDALIVHGIWQYQSQAVHLSWARTGVPYFVFVHGALDPWFARQYRLKNAKKSLYWRLFERRAVRDARAVLFTSEDERLLANASFTPYRATEAVVPIGIEEPPGDPETQHKAFLCAHPNLSGKRLLLFLGRLHQKKGCELLLRAFAELSSRDESLHLVFAGPSEGATASSLTATAHHLGVGERTTCTGMLTGDLKWGAFRAADAFVLPSHSENFGIAVVEALACGVPVLLSDKVNIWREIEGSGAGLVDSDTLEGATRLLDRWLALGDVERMTMRTRARQCYAEKFEAHTAAVSCAGIIAGAVGLGGPHE